MKLPASDLLADASKFFLGEWQDIWNCCEGNKLHAIYPDVRNIRQNKNLTRHDAVILNRLRICRSRLTHSHLLLGEDQPACAVCNLPLTIKHILLECPDLQDIRGNHIRASSSKE